MANESETTPVDALRLPKKVEADAAAEKLASELVARARPLWGGAELAVAQVDLGADLEAALKGAFSSGRIVRGYEDAQRVLAAEQHGLSRVDERTGVVRGCPVLRPVVVSSNTGRPCILLPILPRLKRYKKIWLRDIILKNMLDGTDAIV